MDVFTIATYLLNWFVEKRDTFGYKVGHYNTDTHEFIAMLCSILML